MYKNTKMRNKKLTKAIQYNVSLNTDADTNFEW